MLASTFFTFALLAVSSIASPLVRKSTNDTSAPIERSTTYKGGYATYFYQGGVAGACGKVHKDTDLVVAMDERRYGDSDKKSWMCGKKVHITNKKNGKSVTATIADDCPSCANSNSIDLSKSAFKKIAPLDDGMVPITWYLL